VQALVVTPGEAGSARVAELPDPRPEPGQVLLRTLEVGVCGTDAEIAHGLFGVAPPGRAELVLGHELLGEVVDDTGLFAAGDLVAATVRRSCGRCDACAAGSPDACLSGAYTERGITSLDGFASELTAEWAEHLVPVPRGLGRLGVLTEPSSICSRALRHTRVIGDRQVWEPRRALVLGAGAIGLLSTFFLRLDGFEVWTASLEPAGSRQAELVELAGARYTAAGPEALAELGGFDVVVEAAGPAEAVPAAIAALRRNGVACILGLDARPGRVELARSTVGVDLVLQNRAVFGSVNAHPQDWVDAVTRLSALNERWPEAAAGLIGLRVPPDRFDEALAFRGGKSTLLFA